MEDKSHEHAMMMAIQSALVGVKENEGGPFGAAIVKEGRIIAVAHNTVLKDNDPTCHAEMNAIRMAAKTLNNYMLTGCHIYSTVEPCPMCLAAIYWARIERIYIAAHSDLAARYGFDDEAFFNVMKLLPEQRSIPSHKVQLAKQSEEVFEVWKGLGRNLY